MTCMDAPSEMSVVSAFRIAYRESDRGYSDTLALDEENLLIVIHDRRGDQMTHIDIKSFISQAPGCCL